eukprot:g4840.t1
MRGIIAVVGLVELENLIKTHLVTRRPELVPEDASEDDFEVYLADYVDCFSGVSAGSWIVAYLASKGGNGVSANILQERRFIEEYGYIAPGSAKALVVFFHEFGNTIYPQQHAIPGAFPVGSTNLTKPGVATPVFDSVGVNSVLKAFVGDVTMAQLSTSCLIPAYEIEIRSSLMFVFDKFQSPPKFGYAKHVHRNKARQLTNDFTPDLQFVEGVNFYVRDVSAGSSAAPVTNAAKQIYSVGGTDTSFLLVDGYMAGGGNPNLQALVYVMNTTNSASFEDIAIISFGTGHSQGEYADNQFGGLAQWAGSGDLVNMLVNAGGVVLQTQFDILFYANPNVKPGQLLRVDTLHDLNTKTGAIVGGFDKSLDVPTLDRIGEELVASYKASMRSFVEKFIFA